MRIALLTPYFAPDVYSGIAQYIEDLALQLANNGHDVEVFSICYKSRCAYEERNGFKVFWVLNSKTLWSKRMPFLGVVRMSFKTRSLLKKRHVFKPFDIVEYPNDGVIGLAALLLKLPCPLPKFVNRLSSPKAVYIKLRNYYRFTEYIEGLQARLSDAIIGNTQANLDICRQAYGFSSDLAHCVILHGLSVESESVVEPCVLNNDNKLSVFFLGRMEDRKGFDLLVKSWPMVVSAVPNARLIAAGEDMPYREGQSFYNWVVSETDSKVFDSIEYLGSISFEDREMNFQCCDICVIPSRYESFCITALEAMRHSKPVVCFDVGGISEVVSHDVSGLLVPQESCEQLAESLITLLKNKEKRVLLGNNAYHELLSKFTLSQMLSKTEDFYYSLILPR